MTLNCMTEIQDLKLSYPLLSFMQFLEEEQENVVEDLDIRALEDGFVSWKFYSFNIT